MTLPGDLDDGHGRAQTAAMDKPFWTSKPLEDMTAAEWESLCDGCGKCCLNKLEDADTGEVFFTRIACRLLDDQTCRCGQYEERKRFVPECVVLTPKTISKVAYWMPSTCAYRLLHQGQPLPAATAPQPADQRRGHAAARIAADGHGHALP